MPAEPALLADPIGDSLRGAHRALALGDGPAIRYRPEICPFASLGPDPADEAWAALAALPGDFAGIGSEHPLAPGAGWVKGREFPVLEMMGPDVGSGTADVEVTPLDRSDVPEMLDLTERTQPGPFLAETIAFGGYVGVRRQGRLVAMAGRRLHPPGWIEVSAVCTDPDHRGEGLARRVMEAVIRGIRDEGAQPFLHVLPTNPAVRLYEAMGFEIARESLITVVERG